MADKKNKVETKIKFEPIDTNARKALDFHAGDTVKGISCVVAMLLPLLN